MSDDMVDVDAQNSNEVESAETAGEEIMMRRGAVIRNKNFLNKTNLGEKGDVCWGWLLMSNAASSFLASRPQRQPKIKPPTPVKKIIEKRKAAERAEKKKKAGDDDDEFELEDEDDEDGAAEGEEDDDEFLEEEEDDEYEDEDGVIHKIHKRVEPPTAMELGVTEDQHNQQKEFMSVFQNQQTRADSTHALLAANPALPILTADQLSSLGLSVTGATPSLTEEETAELQKQVDVGSMASCYHVLTTHCTQPLRLLTGCPRRLSGGVQGLEGEGEKKGNGQ
jgi:hypothetical protein